MLPADDPVRARAGRRLQDTAQPPKGGRELLPHHGAVRDVHDQPVHDVPPQQRTVLLPPEDPHVRRQRRLRPQPRCEPQPGRGVQLPGLLGRPPGPRIGPQDPQQGLGQVDGGVLDARVPVGAQPLHERRRIDAAGAQGRRGQQEGQRVRTDEGGGLPQPGVPDARQPLVETGRRLRLPRETGVDPRPVDRPEQPRQHRVHAVAAVREVVRLLPARRGERLPHRRGQRLPVPVCVAHQPVEGPLEAHRIVGDTLRQQLLHQFLDRRRRGSDQLRLGHGRQDLLVGEPGPELHGPPEQLHGGLSVHRAQQPGPTGQLQPYGPVHSGQMTTHKLQPAPLELGVLVPEDLRHRRQQLGRRTRIPRQYLADQRQLRPHQLLLGPEERRPRHLGQSAGRQRPVRRQPGEGLLRVPRDRRRPVRHHPDQVRDPLTELRRRRPDQPQDVQREPQVTGTTAPQQPGDGRAQDFRPVQHALRDERRDGGGPVRPGSLGERPGQLVGALRHRQRVDHEDRRLRVLPQPVQERGGVGRPPPAAARPELPGPAEDVAVRRRNRAARTLGQSADHPVAVLRHGRPRGESARHFGQPLRRLPGDRPEHQVTALRAPGQQIAAAEPGRRPRGPRVAAGPRDVQRAPDVGRLPRPLRLPAPHLGAQHLQPGEDGPPLRRTQPLQPRGHVFGAPTAHRLHQLRDLRGHSTRSTRCGRCGLRALCALCGHHGHFGPLALPRPHGLLRPSCHCPGPRLPLLRFVTRHPATS
ncbi:hypothetical protein SNARM312S_03092 [Streptomyces narbonensis]